MEISTRKRARCHPDRPEHGRGLCFECYTKKWNAADPRTPKCTMHPHKPIYTRGLCFECINSEWQCG